MRPLKMNPSAQRQRAAGVMRAVIWIPLRRWPWLRVPLRGVGLPSFAIGALRTSVLYSALMAALTCDETGVAGASHVDADRLSRDQVVACAVASAPVDTAVDVTNGAGDPIHRLSSHSTFDSRVVPAPRS